jgi:hypothetical protein
MTRPFSTRLFLRMAIGLALLLAAVGSASADDTPPTFISWEDATSGYSFDVPNGWQVVTTTVEVLGAPSPQFMLVAPDHAAVVFAGTPAVNGFLDLDPALGIDAGTQLPLNGVTFTVQDYQPATDYLEAYLRDELLVPECETLTVTHAASLEAGVGIDAGELRLSCTEGATVSSGYFYLETISVPLEDAVTLWLPGDLYGYIAAPEYEAQAMDALVRLNQTFAINETPVREIAVAPTAQS